MIILGIDPALHCGWHLVHRRKDGAIVKRLGGTWKLRERSDGIFSGVPILELYYRLKRVGRVDVCMIEEVRHNRGPGYWYGALAGITMFWCEKENELQEPRTAYRGVHVKTLKKFATGNGNAGKDAMTIAARKKLPGYHFTDDNEVDAYWLTEWAIKNLTEAG